MHILKSVIVYITILLLGTNILYAATSSDNQASNRQGNPMQMLDNFANKVNKEDRIQDTALNDITDKQGQYASEFKIANTADSIRIQIAPYIQRTIYIGLSLAVMGIIYNGFLMVTNSVGEDGTLDKVKKRLINICIGVGILSGFYVIIQLFLAIIGYILPNTSTI